mmetsp:Transcript_16971/g.27591  ORF Transcript_16971/g.27591 Transcript_16971/m.27591 type:complete len:128 (-) Transcript_16971:195-578(-)
MLLPHNHNLLLPPPPPWPSRHHARHIYGDWPICYQRPRDIDTNAVLQPFAVEKDRSPTIRRFQPGDEEADMEALDLAYNSDEKEGGARQGQGGGGETGDLEGERGKNDDGNSEEDESKKKTEIEKNT